MEGTGLVRRQAPREPHCWCTAQLFQALLPEQAIQSALLCLLVLVRSARRRGNDYRLQGVGPGLAQVGSLLKPRRIVRSISLAGSAGPRCVALSRRQSGVRNEAFVNIQ